MLTTHLCLSVHLYLLCTTDSSKLLSQSICRPQDEKYLDTLDVDQEYFQLFHHLPFASTVIQNLLSSFLAYAKWTKWGERKGKKITQMFIVTSKCSKIFIRMIEKCWTNHQIMFHIWNYTFTAGINYVNWLGLQFDCLNYFKCCFGGILPKKTPNLKKKKNS